MGMLVFIVIVVIIIVVVRRRKPTKTDTRYTSFWGTKKRKIKYHDSGKVVRQSRRFDCFGRNVKKTYVEKKCFRCGRMVRAGANGKFHCCNRTFR